MKLAHFVFALILAFSLTFPCPSLAASANFSLSPETIQSKSGDKFDLNLSINSGSTKLDALEINLVFDPQKLELTNFVPTNIFNAEIRKTIDNKAGSLLWTTTDITKPRKVISGNINLGTLTFKTKESGQSTISFNKAQVGSIDGPIISSKNSVQVNIVGDQNIFQKIIAFFKGLLKIN